jgi:hypothetical protein
VSLFRSRRSLEQRNQRLLLVLGVVAATSLALFRPAIACVWPDELGNWQAIST